MSVQKKRKTRLKGTENKKPCFDCGKTKDRFKDFKPRWAGCAKHRTDRGRRFHQAGCAECDAIVNGNIRQPRCIECDRTRPKKQAEGAGEPTTPTIEALAAVGGEPVVAQAALTTEEPSAPPLNLPAAVTEGKSAVVAEQPGAVEVPVSEGKPEDILGLPEKVEAPKAEPVIETPVVVTDPVVEEPKVEAPVVQPEPVVVATPEPTAAPAPEATPVVVAPKPAVPTPKKKVASKADLFALFAGDAEPTSDSQETKPPF